MPHHLVNVAGRPIQWLIIMIGVILMGLLYVFSLVITAVFVAVMYVWLLVPIPGSSAAWRQFQRRELLKSITEA